MCDFIILLCQPIFIFYFLFFTCAEEIATFPVDSRYFAEVLRRVELAREIDSLTHQYEKKKHKNNWFQKAAEEMDIILDEELNPLYPLCNIVVWNYSICGVLLCNEGRGAMCSMLEPW